MAVWEAFRERIHSDMDERVHSWNVDHGQHRESHG